MNGKPVNINSVFQAVAVMIGIIICGPIILFLVFSGAIIPILVGSGTIAILLMGDKAKGRRR